MNPKLSLNRLVAAAALALTLLFGGVLPAQAALPDHQTRYRQLPIHYVLLIQRTAWKKGNLINDLRGLIRTKIPQVIDKIGKKTVTEPYISVFLYGIKSSNMSFKGLVEPIEVLWRVEGPVSFYRIASKINTSSQLNANYTAPTVIKPAALNAVGKYFQALPSNDPRKEIRFQRTVFLNLTDGKKNSTADDQMNDEIYNIARGIHGKVKDESWAYGCIDDVRKYYRLDRKIRVIQNLVDGEKIKLIAEELEPKGVFRENFTEIWRPSDLIRVASKDKSIKLKGSIPVEFLFPKQEPQASFHPHLLEWRFDSQGKWLSREVSKEELEEKPKVPITVELDYLSRPGQVGGKGQGHQASIALLYDIKDPIYGLQSAQFLRPLALNLNESAPLPFWEDISNERLAGFASWFTFMEFTQLRLWWIYFGFCALLILLVVWLSFRPLIKLTLVRNDPAEPPAVIDFNQGPDRPMIAMGFLNIVNKRNNSWKFGEKSFSVRVDVADGQGVETCNGDLPAKGNMVCLDSDFAASRRIDRCSPNQEVTVFLATRNIQDYRGVELDPSYPFSVSVSHLKKLPWRRWKKVDDVEIPVGFNFLPQRTEPKVDTGFIAAPWNGEFDEIRFRISTVTVEDRGERPELAGQAEFRSNLLDLPQEKKPTLGKGYISWEWSEEDQEHRIGEIKKLGRVAIRSSADYACSDPVDCSYALRLTRNRGEKGSPDEPHFSRGEVVFGKPEASVDCELAPRILEGKEVEGVKGGFGNAVTVKGIKHGQQVSLPLLMDFDILENPKHHPDKYTVEVVRLKEDTDQPAEIESVAGSFQVQKDSRSSHLVIEVAPWHKTESNTVTMEPDVFSPNNPIRLALPDSVLWTHSGRGRSIMLGLEVSNTARNGDGKVLLSLKDVELGGDDIDSLSPVEEEREADALLWRLAEGCDHLFKREGGSNWRLEVLDTQSPAFLRLDFDPQCISGVEEYLNKLEAKFSFHWEERKDLAAEAVQEAPASGDFDLIVEFKLEKYTGRRWLAMDVGSSAVAMAWEERSDRLRRVSKGLPAPDSILDLQHQYITADWGGPDKKGNLEAGTRFIPSWGSIEPTTTEGGLTKDLRSTDPGFFNVPLDDKGIIRWHDRLVPFLKNLISQNVSRVALRSEIDFHNDKGKQEKGFPLLEDTVVSAYRTFYERFIRPHLEQNNQLQDFHQLIVAYPNTFTLKNEEFLQDILRHKVFTRLHGDNVLLMRESDAAALYFLFREDELRKKSGQPPREAGSDKAPDGAPTTRDDERSPNCSPDQDTGKHILVYDIGAGTLDLTYMEVTKRQGTVIPERINYKAKTGLPVAGNKLDEAIACHVHRRLKGLEASFQAAMKNGEYSENKDLTEVPFKYVHRIIQEKGVEPVPESDRREAMFKLWAGILQFKKDYSANPKAEEIPLLLGDHLSNKRRPVAHGVATHISKTTLEEKGVLWDEIHKNISISINIEELRKDPAIRNWERLVADWVVCDFFKMMPGKEGLHPVDCFVFTGRTGLWPGLQDQVLKIIQENATEPEKIFSPEFTEDECKIAVVSGMLLYALRWGEHISFNDRNIWGRYGLVYTAPDGRRKFANFFPRDLTEYKNEQRGKHTVYFPDDEGWIDVSDSEEVQVVFALCSDPEAVLNSDDPEYDLIRRSALKIIARYDKEELKPTGNKVKYRAWVNSKSILGWEVGSVSYDDPTGSIAHPTAWPAESDLIQEPEYRQARA